MDSIKRLKSHHQKRKVITQINDRRKTCLIISWKGSQGCWMGRRIKITRLSIIYHWKSQKYHCWCLESQIILINRYNQRFSRSFCTFQQTLKNTLQTITLGIILQDISLNYIISTSLIWLIRSWQNYWLMRLTFIKDFWIKRNWKKGLSTFHGSLH